MTIARFIPSLAILLLAVYIAAMNWGCVIVSRRNKRRGIDRHHSTVPIVTFILAVIALVLYPGHGKAAWMLAVPVLDIGNWIVLGALVWLPVMSIRGSRKKPDTGSGAKDESK